MISVAQLLFLLPGLFSTSQAATLSGTVTDRTSGLPLPYVSVVLPELNRGGHTDLHGYYSEEYEHVVRVHPLIDSNWSKKMTKKRSKTHKKK